MNVAAFYPASVVANFGTCFKRHPTGFDCEKSVVAAPSDIIARQVTRSALTDENGAARCGLAGKKLDAEPLTS